jgi:hypothetical protein
MNLNLTAYLAIGSLVLLCALATALLLRSNAYDNKQRRLQLALIWLLPIGGAVFVLLVLWSQAPQVRRGKSDVDHEAWENAQDKAHGVE